MGNPRLNCLPVGSEEATKFYAECALEAGVALINNIPVFIASNAEWAKKFEEDNIPTASCMDGTPVCWREVNCSCLAPIIDDHVLGDR